MSGTTPVGYADRGERSDVAQSTLIVLGVLALLAGSFLPISAGAQYTFVGAGDSERASPSAPGARQAGDLLLLFTSHPDTTTLRAPPSGWAVLYDYSRSSGNSSIALLGRHATGDSNDHVRDHDFWSAGDGSAQIAAFRTAGEPVALSRIVVNVAAEIGRSEDHLPHPALSVSTPGVLVVALAHKQRGSNHFDRLSDPSWASGRIGLRLARGTTRVWSYRQQTNAANVPADRWTQSEAERGPYKSFLVALAAPGAPGQDGVTPSGGVDCPPDLGPERVDGDVSIAAACRLDRTRVRGKVRVFDGGSLTADRADIRGNVEARGGDFVMLIETEVDGNVRLEGLVGDLSRIDLSEIDGNLELRGNRSRLEIEDNEVDGNVRVERNTGGVVISGNRIDGDLLCRNNDPAPVGGNNRVSGRAQDQCADLSPEGSVIAPGPEPAEDDAGEPPAADEEEEPASVSPGGEEPRLEPQPSGGGAAFGPLEAALLLFGALVSLLSRAAGAAPGLSGDRHWSASRRDRRRPASRRR